jgi:hypothetical protein
LRRFDIGEGGEVNLVAEVALEKGDNHEPAGMRTVNLRVAPNSASTPALLGAMSVLVGQLADEIGALARATSATPSVLGENTVPGSSRMR